MNSKRHSFPNWIFVVLDPSEDVDIPMTTGGQSIVGTASCVAVVVLGASDGEAEVSLGAYDADEMGDVAPAFDHIITTPGRTVSVCTVLWETVLECSVLEETTRIRIWTNRSTTPDVVKIAVGD